MKKLKLLMMCSCLYAGGNSLGWGADCLLKEADDLCSRLAAAPEDKTAREKLGAIDLFAAKKLSAEELIDSDRYYFEGYQAWRSKKYLEAKNAWYKYLAYSTQEKRKAEVSEYFNRVKTILSEQKPPEILSEHEKPGLYRKHSKSQSAQNKKTGISYEEILLRASRAREHGQLEKALKLYHMALQMQPSSSEARDFLAQVEREMK